MVHLFVVVMTSIDLSKNIRPAPPQNRRPGGTLPLNTSSSKEIG